MLLEINPWYYVLAFLAAGLLSFVLTLVVKKVARQLDIVDKPEREPDKKIHKKPIPLLGGIAVFLAFAVVLLIAFYYTPIFEASKVKPIHIYGILLGGLILMIEGIFDDVFSWPWYKIFPFTVLAALVVVFSDIGIAFISNPLGGTIRLDSVILPFSWLGKSFEVMLWADIFTFWWVMGMMYTTKFLDGLDGLVAGVSVIGGLVLFFLSQHIHEPQVALIAIVFAGAMFGFLLLNFNPAKIFMGDGCSLFAGYMLAILGILAVGKVATAFLIMGIPILDTFWIIFRRFFIEKKSPLRGDRRHLHHRLLDVGWSQKQIVLLFYSFAGVFGIIALYLQSFGKLIALIILSLVMVFMAVTLVVFYRRQYENEYEIKS